MLHLSSVANQFPFQAGQHSEVLVQQLAMPDQQQAIPLANQTKPPQVALAPVLEQFLLVLAQSKVVQAAHAVEPDPTLVVPGQRSQTEGGPVLPPKQELDLQGVPPPGVHAAKFHIVLSKNHQHTLLHQKKQ